MPVDAGNAKVVHNTEEKRFEIKIDENLCVLEYDLRGQTIYFTHTGVPQPLEGQGLAARLAKAGLDYAREKALKVVPACEFIYVYLRRHPEYQDIVRKP